MIASASGPMGSRSRIDVNRLSLPSRWFRARSPEPLVDAARRGDAEAFGALVERHADQVLRVALRLTRRRQDAEEVVQETFLRAHRQLRRFRGASSFATWLHRIAVRCAYDLLRSEGRSPVVDGAAPWDRQDGEEPSGGFSAFLESDLPGPDRVATSAEIQRRIDATLRDLTPMERTAFVLRHVEGLSIAEIADALGASRGGTKQAIFRAIAKLREQLAPLKESP
jgi:RNA polymerase sigma-70 factor (ECF subfamily)